MFLKNRLLLHFLHGKCVPLSNILGRGMHELLKIWGKNTLDNCFTLSAEMRVMDTLKRLESKLEGRTEVFYTAWWWLTANSIMVSYKGHHFSEVLMAPSHLLSNESAE